MITTPNLLWIMTDQHRRQAMGCAGDANIDTPHLDRIAEEGIRFTNAYSNAPNCATARACLHTGQYITSHGVLAQHYPLVPGRAKQMAEAMRAHGYQTCHYGKWNLSGGTTNQHFVSPYFRPGWQEWIGWESMHGDGGDRTYFNTAYSEGVSHDTHIKYMDRFQPDWLTRKFVEWLGRQRDDQPWFHVLSIETPHEPCDFPRNVQEYYYRQFNNLELQVRPNFDERKREELDGHLRGYYAHVKNIDDNIGGMLQALEESDQLEQTIIVYLSDHGDFLGSHGRRGKGRPEEESSGIPLLMRLPGDPQPGRVSDAFISLVDLMPTMLGLCGAPVPESCDGSNLESLVRGERAEGTEEVYMQFEDEHLTQRRAEKIWRAVRHGHWMYSVTMDQGPNQLFDLENDPYQRNNLIEAPFCAAIRDELHTRIVLKAAEIGDDFFDRLGGHIRQTQSERTYVP